jgi:chemotaxis signal transduction protein
VNFPVQSRATFDWDALKRRTTVSHEHSSSPQELERIFSERARALSEASDDRDQISGQILFSFVHAGIRLAVDTASVLRILRPRPVTVLPGAPSHLNQVFYEAGRIVSLADVALLLGRSTAAHSGARIVLLEGKSAWLGVVTDSVLGPTRIDTARLGAPSPHLDPRIARCVRGVGDDMTVVLDGALLVESLRD